MTDIVTSIEKIETPRWAKDVRDELFGLASLKMDRVYQNWVGQVVRHGGSIKKSSRQFASNQNFFFFISDPKIAHGFIESENEDISWWAKDTTLIDLHKLESDGLSSIYRVADLYSGLPSPSDSITGLCGLQLRLTEATQYVARAAVQIISQRPFSSGDAQNSPSERWVEKSVSLEREGNGEQSLDVIFDHIDDLLLSSRFAECDSSIAAIPPERMSNAQLLTVLTATADAKHLLPSRSDFFRRVESLLESRGADAKGLLVGLE